MQNSILGSHFYLDEYKKRFEKSRIKLFFKLIFVNCVETCIERIRAEQSIIQA